MFRSFGLLTLTGLAILAVAPLLFSQDKPVAAAQAAPAFDSVADKALAVMKKTAEDLHTKGVAAVSYAEGETVTGWSSRMLVVGDIVTPSGSTTRPGNNCLGIVYSKTAEMALTLKNSGSHSRPTMVGENGWQGGLTTKGKTGNWFVAFSGGATADDLKISHAGLEVVTNSF